MRIAVLILGLITLIPLTMQSLIASLDTDSLSPLGIIVAILWLIGSAIVIPAPRGSMVTFILAGGLAFAISGDYPDMQLWGAVAIIFAIMSYVGMRQKRRADAEHQRLVAAVERMETIRQTDTLL